jgi:Zn-dependent protease
MMPEVEASMYDEQGALYIPPGYGKIRFSRTETMHILIAMAVLIFAFYMTLTYTMTLTNEERLYYLAASSIAVVTGFLLHELAHKFLAQRYGAWAEFRVFPLGLIFALFLALFTGLLFAAPGAVYIQGRITKEQNGKISLAGPAVNLAFGLICLGLFFLFPLTLLYIVAYINLLLAVFNLVPIGPLDGGKVARWNIGIYIVTIGAAAAALFFTLYYL